MVTSANSSCAAARRTRQWITPPTTIPSACRCRSAVKPAKCCKKHCIDALPILNKRGVITDIVFARGEDVDNRKRADIPVVMMAGGLGTRLYPYTKILPKPLIPVGEQPIAELIMDASAILAATISP